MRARRCCRAWRSAGWRGQCCWFSAPPGHWKGWWWLFRTAKWGQRSFQLAGRADLGRVAAVQAQNQICVSLRGLRYETQDSKPTHCVLKRSTAGGGMFKTRVTPCGQPYGVAHPAQTWMRRHSRRHTKFGRDETPLCGGGCNRATNGVLKHRAFRPGANLPPNCDLVDMQSPSRLDAHNTRPAPLL